MFRNKNKKRCNRFLNSGGYSLVEVLIAISILIIIAVPLALNLVSSAQINSRAKQMHEASDVANSLAEVMRAVDLSDILSDMNGYAIDENGNQLSYTVSGNFLKGCAVGGMSEVVLKDGKYFAVSDDNASVQMITQNGVNVPKFIGNDEQIYYYLISDVESVGMNLDVFVTAKFEKTIGAISLNPNVLRIRQDVNMDADVADEFENANKVYVALNATAQNMDAYSQSAQWFLNNMERTIEIVIDEVGGGVVEISVRAIYTSSSNYLYESDKTIVKNLGSTMIASANEIDNGFYLYYYALFDAATPRDRIVISNQDEVDVPIYLVAESSDSSIDFESIENYHPTVQLEELVAGEVPHAKVYSNVNGEMVNSLLLPNDTEFKVYDINRTPGLQSLYTITIQIYQHRGSCYIDGGFAPNSSYLLAESVGTCMSKACVRSEDN